MATASPFFLQLIALGILLAGLGLAWRQWARPHGATLDLHGKALMLTLVMTMVGGFAGTPSWWMDYPASFSWDLPALASRMLAAAAVAFGVAGILVLRRPAPGPVRLYLVMLATYLTPLVAAILLFHLDRFDWQAPITYGFFVIAGGLTAASLWHLARRTRGPAIMDEPGAPGPAVSMWLMLVTIVSGLWGLALYLMPEGPLPAIWIWPSDALTSRLIGTMLLTIAAMTVMARRSAALSRIALTTCAVYGAGAVAAGAMNAAAAKPLPLAYMIALGVMAAASLVLRAGAR